VPVDSKPHSSWADVYDLVYEHSFRNFYHELTNVTLSVIEDRVNSNSRIVDFGAGTGRLSIPLSKKGFDVVAVDPCEEMQSSF
jgi:2-polyprenyl-3-methyl-5-hydroxy-6-metoxy-1,4-benzoquinol methylase